MAYNPNQDAPYGANDPFSNPYGTNPYGSNPYGSNPPGQPGYSYNTGTIGSQPYTGPSTIAANGTVAPNTNTSTIPLNGIPGVDPRDSTNQNYNPYTAYGSTVSNTGSLSMNTSDPVTGLNQYLAMYPNSPQQAINEFNQQYPNTLAPAWYSGTKTIGLNNGTYLVQPGTGGNTGNTWQVVQRGDESGSGSSSTTATDNPFLQTYRDAMLQALRQFQTPTSPDNPTIAPQISAAKTANARGLEQAQQALAERAYANGTLNTSGYDQLQQKAIEDAGQSEAATEAGLVNQGEQQRLGMLSNILGLGTGQGLQEELAGGNLGYQYAALQAAMNRDSIIQLLYNQAYGG